MTAVHQLLTHLEATEGESGRFESWLHELGLEQRARHSVVSFFRSGEKVDSLPMALALFEVPSDSRIECTDDDRHRDRGTPSPSLLLFIDGGFRAALHELFEVRKRLREADPEAGG